MEIQSNNSPVTIGYYPIRLKGQLCRLLCQYLHIDYQDKFFDPHSWNKFKQNQAKNWIFKDLPFLKDGDFVVTGTLGIATYLTQKAGKNDLFGRTLLDKTKIDNLCKKCDILMMAYATYWCSLKHDEIGKNQYLQSNWQKKIKPLIMNYQQDCQLSPWFFSYITIIDFSVYQIVNQMENLYPTQMAKFIKLKKLQEKVSKILEIQNYQKSQRAVKKACPVWYFKCFKEQKINNLSECNSTSSLIKKEMDLQ